MLDRARIARRMATLCGMAVVFAMTLSSQPSVLTWHNDNFRTGQNLQETILTPANVKMSTFGKLFTIGVDGAVDAQPLYVPGLPIPGQGVHNVLYIATEHDSVYAFDADSGALLKHVSLLVGNETTSDIRNCGQVSPEIGVTATPVIDPQSGPHGTIYVVAMTKDTGGNYHHRLHALDLTTLGEEFSGPVEVVATYPGLGDEKKNQADTVQTFLPAQHKDRAALLLSNGIVYTSWSSHCDFRPYTSWVIGYNETTLAQATVLNLVPNGSDGGIWASGSGPQADGAGNVYIPTGNGTFDTTLLGNGLPSKNDYGNAYVKMSTSGGTLAVVDYFTMSNTVSESGGDTDLGSGGGMLLPTLLDAGGHARDLAVVAGKDANIYVMDRANLGKFHPSTDEIYQQLTGVLPAGVWSSPAWFNGTLYYGALGNVLKAFVFANGSFNTNPASQTSATFDYPGTTPSISANGSSNGIVWATSNGAAVLHAYAANNLGNELYNSNQAPNGRDKFGGGNKFVFPTIANGKVYVASNGGVANQPGSVAVFGLLARPIAPLSVTPGSGSGSSQTFAFTFSDANGAGDIASTQIDINSALTSTGACYFYYARGANAIYLAKDGGAWQGPLTIGSAGILQNSQCVVDAGGSSVAMSGNTLTLNLALSFEAGFAGAKNIFMEVQSAAQDSGWSTMGTWTVTTGGGPSPDFSLGISAGPGTVAAGASAPYSVTVTGSNGFNGTVSFGVSGLPAGVAGSFNPSTATGSGSTTLTIATTLGASPGSFTITATATSGSLHHNATASLTITGASGGPPAPVSVTPNTGSGPSQTFAFAFSDPNGAADITSAQLDISAALVANNACYFYYARGANAIYLASDAAAWQGPLTIGSSGTLQNSQCVVDAGASSVSMLGNTLTLNLALSFKAAFTGVKNIYMEVQNSIQDSGWSPHGTWTVTTGGALSPPTPVSVTPSSGSGSSQTFAFVFSDPNGVADILSTQIDVNATLMATGACYFYYARGANAIYLANDTGAWQGPLTIGSAGTLQNSQCSVNAGSSSMSAVGNTLTLNLALTFKAGFAGAKKIYMEVQNGAQDSGWSLHGTWTAQ